MTTALANKRFHKFCEAIADALEMEFDKENELAIKKAMRKHYPETFGKVDVSAGKKRPVSGWNAFMREFCQGEDMEGVDPRDRLRLASEDWRARGVAGKAKWCKEHEYPVPKAKKSDEEAPKAPKKRKPVVAEVSDEEAPKAPKKRKPVVAEVSDEEAPKPKTSKKRKSVVAEVSDEEAPKAPKKRKPVVAEASDEEAPKKGKVVAEEVAVKKEEVAAKKEEVAVKKEDD